MTNGNSSKDLFRDWRVISGILLALATGAGGGVGLPIGGDDHDHSAAVEAQHPSVDADPAFVELRTNVTHMAKSLERIEAQLATLLMEGR